MGNKDYSLTLKLGFTATSDLDDFFQYAKEGDSVPVTIEGTDNVVPLVMVERIQDKYGLLTHKTEYTNTSVLYVISCDKMLYVAGLDVDNEWGYDDSETIPDEFFPINGYNVDIDGGRFVAEKIDSLRDQECLPVDSLASVSRFGGWPVDSSGRKLETWPHINERHAAHPLVFQAQYKLPDGRMVWVFVNGVEALQTVLPMEEDPLWNGESHYVDGMSGAELFDIVDRLYSRDQWHYDNREFLGQKRPIRAYSDTWKWEDNGLAVIVEGGPIPAWITMKSPIAEMLPFLTVSEDAKSFPLGMRHVPSWLQSEKHDAYDFREFLFQIDDLAGGIDFDYGDMGSLYVYWNGKDAGVGSIQCY